MVGIDALVRSEKAPHLEGAGWLHRVEFDREPETIPHRLAELEDGVLRTYGAIRSAAAAISALVISGDTRRA